jgi:organic radical activating enzyme
VFGGFAIMNIKTKGTVFEEWGNYLPMVGENIVVYGRSTTALRLIPKYISMGLIIEAILDKDPSLNGTDYQGIPIVNPDEYRNKDRVIIITTGFVFRNVEKNLKRKGFNKILPYYFYILDKEIEISFHNLEDIQAAYFDKWILSRPQDNVLNYVDIPITMRCSMRCKDCANLMQYFKAPKHSDFDVLSQSIKKLFETLEHIFEVRVLGGEPFLNPDLYKYIDLIKKYSSKYTLLTILTNGTIIPDQKTLERLSDSKIILKISDYKHSRQKIPEIINVCEENKIFLQINSVLEWQDCSKLNRCRRTTAESMAMLRTCLLHNCGSIVDGKLFFCPFAGNLYALKAAPASYHEYVPLVDKNISGNKLREQINRLMRLKYLRACDFCGGRPAHGNSIPPAIQTNEPLDYQVYIC